MNRRLISALLRRQPEPAPAIVPFLLDAIDHCDPTRSHEAKPSARLRARHQSRQLLLGVAAYIGVAMLLLGVAALLIRGTA